MCATLGLRLNVLAGLVRAIGAWTLPLPLWDNQRLGLFDTGNSAYSSPPDKGELEGVSLLAASIAVLCVKPETRPSLPLHPRGVRRQTLALRAVLAQSGEENNSALPKKLDLISVPLIIC